jgi:hypothetical protein
MKTFAIAVVLISGTILFAAAPTRNTAPFFQAFCNDGDGALTDWLSSRYEVYMAGRDHELAFRGHRWDILVQQGETVIRVPACARLTDGKRPQTVVLENSCGQCVRFMVTRTNADGDVKSREFKLDSKKQRGFRRPAGSVVTVDGERDCSD